MESIGNGGDETETISSSKTFAQGGFAVVFTRRAIPCLSGRKDSSSGWMERNSHLVDRGEESCKRCVYVLDACACVCVLLQNFDATTSQRIDANLFHHSLHFSFFYLPFLELDVLFHRFTWRNSQHFFETRFDG